MISRPIPNSFRQFTIHQVWKEYKPYFQDLAIVYTMQVYYCEDQNGILNASWIKCRQLNNPHAEFYYPHRLNNFVLDNLRAKPHVKDFAHKNYELISWQHRHRLTLYYQLGQFMKRCPKLLEELQNLENLIQQYKRLLLLFSMQCCISSTLYNFDFYNYACLIELHHIPRMFIDNFLEEYMNRINLFLSKSHIYGNVVVRTSNGKGGHSGKYRFDNKFFNQGFMDHILKHNGYDSYDSYWREDENNKYAFYWNKKFTWKKFGQQLDEKMAKFYKKVEDCEEY